MSERKTLGAYLSTRLADPIEAAAYLTVSLEAYEADGNRDAFLLALRRVVDAQGGMGALSRKTGLNRQHLYHTLSSSGNPTLKTMDCILDALGCRITITPKDQLLANG